jgi:hypothetical protein
MGIKAFNNAPRRIKIGFWSGVLYYKWEMAYIVRKNKLFKIRKNK